MVSFLQEESAFQLKIVLLLILRLPEKGVLSPRAPASPHAEWETSRGGRFLSCEGGVLTRGMKSVSVGLRQPPMQTLPTPSRGPS